MSSGFVCRVALVAALVSAFAACSGGKGSSGGGSPPPPAATVEETLAAFNVNTAQTPRVDADNEPLPADYRPFGTSRTFDRTDQLAVVGVQLSPASFGFDSTFTVLAQQVDVNGKLSTQALVAPDPSDTPWALSVGATPTALRAVAAGDVDGDGLDELVVLAFTAADGAWYQVWQDANAAYAPGARKPIDLGGTPLALALAVADFDGDGTAEPAVAWTDTAGAHLRFLRAGAGGFEPEGIALTFAQEHAGSTVSVEVAAGNLDWDAGAELVLVVNEAWLSGGQDAGSARFFVLDDAAAGHAEKRHGYVRGTADGTVRTAVLAGVAVGDVDADGLEEVVFGGLTGLDPGRTCSYAYVLVALDDLKHGLAALGAAYVANALQDPVLGNPAPTCDATDPLRLRKVHVRTFDADKNGGAEIQINQLTYHDFGSGTWVRWDTQLPLEQLFGVRPPPVGGVKQPVVLKGTFDATTSALAAADFTLDRAGDLAFVSQLAGPTVRVWSYSAATLGASPTWHPSTTIPLATDPGVPERPLLVAANVKPNGLALKYSDGTYRLVFTEPVVLAALAAAPCSAKLGQDLSNCITEFGTAKSSTVETSKTFTISVGRMVGVQVKTNFFGLESGFELTNTVKAEYERTTDVSQTFTSRVVRTTGPLEDGVVFTSIPYDIYTYRVVSHPNPAYVGKDIVVALPRPPILILAERGFYNSHVAPGAPQIAAEVFRHTPGDPWSYPRATEKDTLLATYGGYSSDQLDVGQGGGTTTAELNVATESGTTQGYGIEAEIELKLTAGVVMGGFSIGGGVSSQLRIAHGTESLYAGTVSSIPDYGAKTFAFGLFTYVYTPKDAAMRPFEVINYWVE